MANSVKKRTDIMNPNGLNEPQEGIVERGSLQPRDVYSSYIFSTSSRSLSKYGERLLMEVISVAQEYTIDAALGIHKLNFAEKYKEKFAIIDIPVKNLLNADDTTNYTKAKEAALELMKIYHTVEAPVLDADGKPKTYKDGSPQYQFASYHLLDKVYVNQKPGIVSVKLGEDTWSQILDMGKGYTRYNLLTAKNLDDVVAIRLFQILSNSSVPLYFSLGRIKGILGLQDKYVNNPTGFIRRVIDPAEHEIKEKCPFEVVHELKYEKTAGKGRPSIVGLTFRKVLKPTIIRNPESVLEPQIINILVKEFGFDNSGIRANLSLFFDVRNAGHNLESFLEKIRDKAKLALKPQGYVIKSLRNLLDGFRSHSVKRVIDIASAHSDPEPAAAPISDAMTTGKSSSGSKGRLEVKNAEAFDNSELEEL